MNIHRRYKPPETPPHRFAIGQQVRMRRGGGAMMNTSAIFQIMATLPPLGRSFQYRIRDVEEKYERITTEDNLEVIDIWAAAMATV
ncbi:hypothetical protein CU102_04075 [Phyllobacterium brassicacearum]|uniref:Uncharacterized protein n=1 Tax=Phyllobacterium brassicacearum TaxID=314235 RepID=A0A2P7BUX1_9HYPH|nr:hypothetical protein [Phyllobacterium brassicacearum]PSH70267.1 hypothetical protein CU102_04075 [Phyllobacterium brassicacearum]TDQ33836.1 hypothetical protein DEV91_10437 [Phyllobacterium brassicacearum]